MARPRGGVPITHLYLLTGGDRLANLAQWLAFAGCVVGSAVVAGELGGGPRARALAAVACATLPMAIAQASSTQNDLVASFWLLSLGYWVLRFRRHPSTGTAALVGVSAGLGVLTKLPVSFLAVPWMLALVVTARPLGRRRALGCALVAGLGAAALNVGHVSRTMPLIGRDGLPSEAGLAADPDRLPPVWTDVRQHDGRSPGPRLQRSSAMPRCTRSRPPTGSTPGSRTPSSLPIA